MFTGTLRRAGARLRINAQLVDTHTDFPLWSERFDREMKDVFEVQDEIARKIAEALRVTLSPQELEALAVKPTENLQAYDLFLRGKRYARRLTRQDLEFSLQMFENAVSIDPNFALGLRRLRQRLRIFTTTTAAIRLDGARHEASGKAVALRPDLPEVQVARLGSYTPTECTTKPCASSSRPSSASAIAKAPIIFSAARSLPPDATRKSPALPMPRSKPRVEDYNVYVPILNSLLAPGQNGTPRNVRQRECAALENHLKQVPEDARARIILAGDYAEMGREEDALRETNLAITLRANEATILYNAACVFSSLKRKPEALDALRKCWDAGFRDVDWARRDPDVAFLHGDPEFERLFPEKAPKSPPAKAGSSPTS